MDSEVADIVAIASDDVWAVGGQSPTGESLPLAAHWDGTRWTLSEPAQPPGLRYPSRLTAVTAAGPHDVWALGEKNAPFATHWDGTQWTIVPAPEMVSLSVFVTDIAAVSRTDVWLTGQFGAAGLDGDRRPLMEHWDGIRRSVVPTPAVPTEVNGSRLIGLAVVSRDDVWAVGERDGRQPTERGCLIERWDGSRWPLVPCPTPIGAETAWLNAATVVSPTDIWAVGGWIPRQVGTEMTRIRTLVEHWDGTAWRVVSTPDEPGDSHLLFTVAARSASDIFAAGEDDLLHWDGTGWRHTSLAPPATHCRSTGSPPGRTAGSGRQQWSPPAQPTRTATTRRSPCSPTTPDPKVGARARAASACTAPLFVKG
jgi:hypothetical protein